MKSGQLNYLKLNGLSVRQYNSALILKEALMNGIALSVLLNLIFLKKELLVMIVGIILFYISFSIQALILTNIL
jgi:hypothetical protein